MSVTINQIYNLLYMLWQYYVLKNLHAKHARSSNFAMQLWKVAQVL